MTRGALEACQTGESGHRHKTKRRSGRQNRSSDNNAMQRQRPFSKPHYAKCVSGNGHGGGMALISEFPVCLQHVLYRLPQPSISNLMLSRRSERLFLSMIKVMYLLTTIAHDAHVSLVSALTQYTNKPKKNAIHILLIQLSVYVPAPTNILSRLCYKVRFNSATQM